MRFSPSLWPTLALLCLVTGNAASDLSILPVRVDRHSSSSEVVPLRQPDGFVQPAGPAQVVMHHPGAQAGRAGASSDREPRLVSELLQSIPEAEREEFAVVIELAPNAPAQAAMRQVEAAWAAGKHAQAIQSLLGLESEGATEARVTLARVKAAAPGRGGESWGVDHEFPTASGSVPLAPNATTHLSAHADTGTMLATFTGGSFLAAYHSVDGETWVRALLIWNTSGVTYPDAETVPIGHDYFLVSAVAPPVQTLFIWRINAATGMADVSSTSVHVTSPVTEISVTSNNRDSNNRIYAMSLHEDNSLQLHWSDQTGAVWNPFPVPVSDALDGLDFEFHNGWASGVPVVLLATYRNVGGELDLLTFLETGTWAPVISLASGLGLQTSVAAHENRFMLAYEEIAGANFVLNYQVSYDGGASWFFGELSTGGGTDYYFPDVTAQGDGGFRAVYLDVGAGATVTRHRDYGTPPWSAPVEISDTGIDLEVRPTVEFVDELGGAHDYGAVWAAAHDPAVFDQSHNVSTGVSEPSALGPLGAPLLRVWPTPYRSGQLNIGLSADAGALLARGGAVSVFDVMGRLVRRLPVDASSTLRWDVSGKAGRRLAPGTYFLRLTDSDQTTLSRQKITVVR